jgi:hypothetical protein
MAENFNFKAGFMHVGDSFGYGQNELDAFEVLTEFEIATVTKYCFYYSKGYGSNGECIFIMIDSETVYMDSGLTRLVNSGTAL